ncbi:unnamed protein product [Camellia sinensis]
MIICDACTPASEPFPTNKRHHAEKIFSHPDVIAEEPWHGIEQEYTLLQKDVKRPIGWPNGGYPGPQNSITYNNNSCRCSGTILLWGWCRQSFLDVILLIHTTRLAFMLGLT